MKGGAKVVIEAHRHEGVFIARSKEDVLVTLNSTPGKDVYGEKRIQVEGPPGADGNPTKLEYRVWNPFRSKLAAAILGGVESIHMGPGSKVLYIGAAAGTTVSHVSDIVGPSGCVYAGNESHIHSPNFTMQTTRHSTVVHNSHYFSPVVTIGSTYFRYQNVVCLNEFTIKTNKLTLF